jgi:hypothetical protein
MHHINRCGGPPSERLLERRIAVPPASQWFAILESIAQGGIGIALIVPGKPLQDGSSASFDFNGAARVAPPQMEAARRGLTTV